MSNPISTFTVQKMSSVEIANLTGKTVGNIHVDIRGMIEALKDDRDFNHKQYQEVKDARCKYGNFSSVDELLEKI